ncbi:MAG: hypothetical protein JST00_20035 [Deltaproteobacteria bacterium]|nr:hypothetical protein [Deltaproteobacteria bacterium]
MAKPDASSSSPPAAAPAPHAAVAAPVAEAPPAPPLPVHVPPGDPFAAQRAAFDAASAALTDAFEGLRSARAAFVAPVDGSKPDHDAARRAWSSSCATALEREQSRDDADPAVIDALRAVMFTTWSA